MLVDIVNASTVVSDTDLQKMLPALQIQVTRDFAPKWGRDARLAYVPTGAKPNPDHAWLVVLDNSDVASALGYHDLSNTGMPLGKVFAETDQKYGNLVSVTLSHELLEMVGDPRINLCAQHGDMLYAYESCDPVEADSDGYEIGGVRVSNFIFPSWFEAYRRATKYDFCKQLKAPRTLRPGGYMSVLHLGNSAGWQQVTADLAWEERDENGRLSPDGAKQAAYNRPARGSRRERRRMSCENWLRSRVPGVVMTSLATGQNGMAVSSSPEPMTRVRL